MSTTPSRSAMSSMMSMTMKQPVLPAPALHGEEGLSQGGRMDPRCCSLLDPHWGEIHRTWNDHRKVYNSVVPGTAMLCDHRLCRVSKRFHHPKGTRARCPRLAPAHLQCTTSGPALGGLLDFTCRTKPSSPVAW